MIVFIIPFVSKQLCKDWQLATALLQGTLDSIANQSDKRFKIVVGCHEIPEVTFKGDRDQLSFLPMPYSPLEQEWSQKSQNDRMMKCCTALLSLKDTDFKYCMAIDADDRIHRDLVAFLQNKPQADGWIVDKGYQVDYGSKRAMKHSKLSKICGSTFILSRDLIGVPQAYTSEEYRKCIYKQGHQTMEEFFREKGFQLNPVPFYSVQYIINHSVSDSMRWRRDMKSQFKKFLKFWILGTRMPSRVHTEFGYAEI